MGAEVYVYAYLVLSAVYAAGCLQYLNSLSRTVQLARRIEAPPVEDAPLRLGSEDQRVQVLSAVRAVLGIDSAAFACAVLPVAYVAVTGLLGNLVTSNSAATHTINPLWLLWTIGLIAAHMFFLVRIIGLNGQLAQAEGAVLSGSFVERHAGMFRYYRMFVLAVTLFNVANTVFMLATLDKIISAPIVL